MTDKKHQYLSVVGCGRSPGKHKPKWSCIAGITSEGARLPGACNHVQDRREARTIFGISPVEAGKMAVERAGQAFDHGKKRRRLRRDGWALLAGVVSYPEPRSVVESDPAAQQIYSRWLAMTLLFLKECFGEHLRSVVEHTDENYLHLHFYVVPELLLDSRLDLHEIHPGLRMKWDAKEANACKKFQDAAYRSGLSRWQDDYWWAVSRHFGHRRYGPKRTRVIRAQRLMQRRMEEERRREQAQLAADQKRLADRAAELDRAHAQVVADARQQAWQDHRDSHRMLRNACITLKERADAERAARRAAETELEILRARLAELDSAPPPLTP
jgi:hypothetical protein